MTELTNSLIIFLLVLFCGMVLIGAVKVLKMAADYKEPETISEDGRD